MAPAPLPSGERGHGPGAMEVEARTEFTKDLALALGLGAAFALLAAPGLDQPPFPVMDEVHHAGSALAWLAGQGATEVTHPPLAKHAMALGAKLAGVPTDALSPAALAAMRAPAVLAGALGVAATYGLGRVLGGRAVGVAAALLLALDGTWLVHARAAMTNAYATAGIAAGALGLVLALRHAKPAWLAAAGLGFGAAIAARWSALPALGLAWALWLAQALQGPAAGLRTPRALAIAASGLVALPLACYALAFAGLGLGPAGVWAAQAGMWAHHAAYQQPHPFQAPWWSWPLMLQPTWYEFRWDPQAGVVRAVWAIGNPAVWWAAVPALALAGWRAARARDAALAAVPVLGLGLWLVWAVQPRAVTFMHYMLEAIPFACVAIALVLKRLWDRGLPGPRLLAVAWLVAAAGWLAYFHPLLTARPIDAGAYAARIWRPEGWDFNAVVNRFRQEHGLEDPAKWKAWRESGGR